MKQCYLVLSSVKKKKKKSQKVKTQKDKKGGRILKSKCALCNSKKSRFIKQPQASGILNS